MEAGTRSESVSEEGSVVGGGGRETLRSTPGQAEGAVTGAGGPNRFTLKSARTSWG